MAAIEQRGRAQFSINPLDSVWEYFDFRSNNSSSAMPKWLISWENHDVARTESVNKTITSVEIQAKVMFLRCDKCEVKIVRWHDVYKLVNNLNIPRFLVYRRNRSTLLRLYFSSADSTFPFYFNGTIALSVLSCNKINNQLLLLLLQ